MTKEDFLKSNTFKVFLILLIVVSIIKIYSAGYLTGQWLHGVTH